MCARIAAQLSVLLIVLLQLCGNVESRICTRAEWAKKDVYETYWHTSLGMKNADPNCTMDCKKEEFVSKYQSGRYVLKNVTIMKSDCCSGYERDYNKSKLVCIPKCSKPCPNGYCRSPDKCGCNEGYITDVRNQYNCLPICSVPCGNYACISPNVCECANGYTFKNGTCQPDCSEPCINGTCVVPGICKCLPGYTHLKENICVLNCSGGSSNNGTCGTDTIDPNHETGIKEWVLSNLMTILTAFGALVVVIAVLITCICIRRAKRNKPLGDNDAAGVPLQEIGPKMFSKSKHEYDVVKKQSQR